METARLFANGRSQAVRLPKSYRFEGNEVYIGYGVTSCIVNKAVGLDLFFP